MSAPTPRRGGPLVNLIIDLLGEARSSGSWFMLLGVAVIALISLLAFLTQTVLPWLVYPGL